MDQQLVDDWCAFCEGRKEFDEEHFTGLFMEMFLDPTKEKKEKDNLTKIFSYFPNSSRVLSKMLRLSIRIPDKTDEQIIDLIRRDLRQKCNAARSDVRYAGEIDGLIALMDTCPIVVTDDRTRFNMARQSEQHNRFLNAVMYFVIDSFPESDKKNDAIYNAFYYVAYNPQLQDSLSLSLLNVDIDFDGYFELFRIGVDYAVDGDKIIAMNYREWARKANQR